MKTIKLMLTFFWVLTALSQNNEVINLPFEQPDHVSWQIPERQFFSNTWQTEVVTNVSEPTMQVFRPSIGSNTGTAVIVAPGGGLYALSIFSEGNEVGEWLAERGITAFVLKYRLVPSGKDGTEEITKLGNTNPKKLIENVKEIMPYAVEDGSAAVKYVRENASDYDIDPKKIGFMGFSAGGAVTMGVAYDCEAENCPDFLVPVYYWYDAMPVQELHDDAPPAFIVCATDDPLGLARASVALYNSFLEKGKPVALHMYGKGGHGFGMREQGLPSDTWIERFHEWAVTEGIVKK